MQQGSVRLASGVVGCWLRGRFAEDEEEEIVKGVANWLGKECEKGNGKVVK